MGNASSFAIAQQCLGPEVAAPVVKSLAGATQQVIEVRNQYRHTKSKRLIASNGMLIPDARRITQPTYWYISFHEITTRSLQPVARTTEASHAARKDESFDETMISQLVSIFPFIRTKILLQ